MADLQNLLPFDSWIRS